MLKYIILFRNILPPSPCFSVEGQKMGWVLSFVNSGAVGCVGVNEYCAHFCRGKRKRAERRGIEETVSHRKREVNHGTGTE